MQPDIGAYQQGNWDIGAYQHPDEEEEIKKRSVSVIWFRRHKDTSEE